MNRVRTNQRRGMTLFELSVVVIIAVVLASLAVLSTQSLLVRTKVSRVQQDQRAIARAIQNYIMDYSALPAPSQGLDSLTQPTAYLGAVPRDPFQREGTYLYLNPGSREFASIIISPGPDGKFDVPPELLRFASIHTIDSRRPGLPIAMKAYPGAGNEHMEEQQPATMTEAEAAILSTYLRLGQYDPAKGTDGDIITIVRY